MKQMMKYAIRASLFLTGVYIGYSKHEFLDTIVSRGKEYVLPIEENVINSTKENGILLLYMKEGK